MLTVLSGALPLALSLFFSISFAVNSSATARSAVTLTVTIDGAAAAVKLGGSLSVGHCFIGNSFLASVLSETLSKLAAGWEFNDKQEQSLRLFTKVKRRGCN